MTKAIMLLGGALMCAMPSVAETWYICGTEIPKTELMNANGTSLWYNSTAHITLKGRIWFESSDNTYFGREGDKYLKFSGSQSDYTTAKGSRAPIIVDGEIQTQNVSLDVSNGLFQVWGSAVPNVAYEYVEFAEENLGAPRYFPLYPVEGSAGVYSGTVTLSEATNFRIKAGEYLYGTGQGNENAEYNRIYAIARDGGYFTAEEGTHIFRVTLDRDAETGLLQEVDENYVDEPRQLALTLGDSDDAIEMKQDAVRPNIYTAVVDVDASDTPIKVSEGEDMIASQSANIGLYRVCVALKGDAAEMDLFLIPEALFAINSFAENVFSFKNPLEMDGTARDGIFSASRVAVRTGGEVFFASCKGEYTEVNATARYGAQNNKTEVLPQDGTENLPISVADGGQPINTFKFADEGTYDISVDFSGYSPVFLAADSDQQTRITYIEAETQDAKSKTYHDILGRPVAKPESGLYIEHGPQGVRKVFIR